MTHSPDFFVRVYQSVTGRLAVDGKPGRETLGTIAAPVSVPAVFRAFHDASPGAVEANLPIVFDALRSAGLADREMTAMALANIRAETAGFVPISELISRYNTTAGGHPFDRYDDRRDIGNRGEPDGRDYRGRGFIQLTGRANYTEVGEALGVNLVSNPGLANDSVIAARILVEFLRRRESRIRDAIARGDMPGARRIVNGGSHGLDRFRDCFRTLILAA